MVLIRSFVFISFLSLTLNSISAETRMKGSAVGAAGMTIEVFVIEDFITFTEKLVATAPIGRDGKFELRLSLDHTSNATIRIGRQQCEMILEPGKEYIVRISGLLDARLHDEDLAPFQVPALIFEIINPWRFELNSLVAEFFLFHDEFMEQHSMALLRQRDQKLVEQYISAVYDLFPGIDNDWFNVFLTYEIAQVELISRAVNPEAIAKNYLKGQEIRYYHISYMDFFRTFFDKRITASRLYTRDELINALSSANSFKAMLELMKKDPLADGEQIRELILLRNIPDLHGLPSFEKEWVPELLKQIRTGSKFAEHRMMAENYLEMFSGLR